MTTDGQGVPRNIASQLAQLRAANGDVLFEAVRRKWHDGWTAQAQQVEHVIDDSGAVTILLKLQMELLESVFQHYSAHEVQDLVTSILESAEVDGDIALRTSPAIAQLRSFSLRYLASEEQSFDHAALTSTFDARISFGINIESPGETSCLISWVDARVSRSDTSDGPIPQWDSIDPSRLFDGETAEQPDGETANPEFPAETWLNDIAGPFPALTRALAAGLHARISQTTPSVVASRPPNFKYEWRSQDIAELPAPVAHAIEEGASRLLRLESLLQGGFVAHGELHEIWVNLFNRLWSDGIRSEALSFYTGAKSETRFMSQNMSVGLDVPSQTPVRRIDRFRKEQPPRVTYLGLLLRGDAEGHALIKACIDSGAWFAHLLELPNITTTILQAIEGQLAEASMLYPFSDRPLSDKRTSVQPPVHCEFHKSHTWAGFNHHVDDVPF